MSIPTREEFRSEVSSFGNAMESQGGNYFLRTRVSTDVEAAEVLAAYDAALARIAELESPAHRARIAREFFEEALRGWVPPVSLAGSAETVLLRWEAAAKEGK